MGRERGTPARKVDLLLDSGAFSAWMRRESIDVRVYCKFVDQFKHLLWHYVTLDVIPGMRDKPRTQEQLADAAQQSYRNHQVMKDYGLSPIPVFHQGEEWSWLERLLKDGEPYIGISPFKDIPVQSQRRWLDQVFSILTDAKGVPFVKTHGFGTTHPKLLVRYPWYTVDSTTWTLTPGYGQIIVPSYGPDGKADYKNPQRIVLSGVQHKSASSQRNQFEALGPTMQAWVRKFLAEEVGVTPAEARYGTGVRRKAVLIYYLRLEEVLQGNRFQARNAGFAKVHMPVKLDPQPHMPFHVVFATNVSREWSHIMNEADARHRLLSYYELRDNPEWVEPYILHGTTKAGYKREQPKANWQSESYKNYRALTLLARGAAFDLREGQPHHDQNGAT